MKARRAPGKPDELHPQCEVQSAFCSGELMATYSVNGSATEGQTFLICGPCAVTLRRGGTHLRQVEGKPT